MTKRIVLETNHLSKTYGNSGYKTEVLKDINLTIYESDFIAIMGPSGSGKTTLLNILSTLDQATRGTILIEEKDISNLSNKELSILRKDKLGFIFQDYNLLDTMSLQDNIALPLALDGKPSDYINREVLDLAKSFGLSEHLSKYPYQLSGGQKQRGAICRALITKPTILFADEPTGALDSNAGRELMESLEQISKTSKTTILLVTHDAFAASYAEDVYMLNDGIIKYRITKGDNRKEFYEKIINTQLLMGSDL